LRREKAWLGREAAGELDKLGKSSATLGSDLADPLSGWSTVQGRRSELVAAIARNQALAGATDDALARDASPEARLIEAALAALPRGAPPLEGGAKLLEPLASGPEGDPIAEEAEVGLASIDQRRGRAAEAIRRLAPRRGSKNPAVPRILALARCDRALEL